MILLNLRFGYRSIICHGSICRHYDKNRICLGDEYGNYIYDIYRIFLVTKWTRYTKYDSSRYCDVCKEKVNGTERLLGVLINEDQFKYTDTYHVECFFNKFSITEKARNLLMKELVY